MKNSSAEVIESIISIVENKMPNYLAGGAEYISKVEFTGKDFPKLFIFQDQPLQIQERINTVTLSLFFADVAEGLNDKQRRDYEIKSDMELACSILIAYLQQEGTIITTVDISADPVYVREGDGLSGISCNLTIQLGKPCIDGFKPTGNDRRYKFNGEVIVRPIISESSITVNINDVTFNASGLDGSFISFDSLDEELNISFNAEKTEIQIQTDDLTERFSNVNVKVTNGFVVSTAVIVLDINAAIPFGIGYMDIPWSGQKTIFNTYDEGWQFQNGELKRVNPPNPEYFAELDLDSANPFTTLINNNSFGNKNRFTDDLGLQVYASGIIQDHYLGASLIVQPEKDFTTHLTDSNAIGYRVVAIPALTHLAQFENGLDLSYPPFTLSGLIISQTEISTCTRFPGLVRIIAFINTFSRSTPVRLTDEIVSIYIKYWNYEV